MNYMLVVRTQVKEILQESGIGIDNLSADFMDKLDQKVKRLILEAVNRAKENSRKTVMGKDVWRQIIYLLSWNQLSRNLFLNSNRSGKTKNDFT